MKTIYRRDSSDTFCERKETKILRKMVKNPRFWKPISASSQSFTIFVSLFLLCFFLFTTSACSGTRNELLSKVSKHLLIPCQNLPSIILTRVSLSFCLSPKTEVAQLSEMFRVTYDANYRTLFRTICVGVDSLKFMR